MPSRRSQPPPSRKRSVQVCPENSQEREAKRLHLERHGNLEETLNPVKTENPSDDEPATATPAIQRDIPCVTGSMVEAASSSNGTTFDELESVRLLASWNQNYEEGSELIRVAFKLVLDRYLDLCSTSAFSGIPQWLTSVLQKHDLPMQNLARMSAALQKAEADFVVRSWIAKHGTTSVHVVLELLQGLHTASFHGVADIVRLVQASHEQAEIAKAQTQLQSKAATGKKASRSAKKAQSQPSTTTSAKNIELKAATDPQPSNGRLGDSSASKAPSKNKSVAKLKTNHAVSEGRGKSMPPGADGNPPCERLPGCQNLPVPGLALANSNEGHVGSERRDLGTMQRTDRGVSQRPSPTPISRPPNVVRYVKADGSNLLVFFIGPSMSLTTQEHITDACMDAFHKRPFHSFRWSPTIWAVDIHSMTGALTDSVKVRGAHLAASVTNSEPKSRFVTCCSRLNIGDEAFKKGIESTIAEWYPDRFTGRTVLYRLRHVQKQREYVFLHLSKEPPRPLFQVPVGDVGSGEQLLVFKPAIMDFQAECFYCEKVHDDLICPDAVEISKFAKVAMSGKR